MLGIADNGSGQLFARSFGDQLKQFLEAKVMQAAEAAEMLGETKQRLNGYLNDQKRLTKEQKIVMARSKPEADFLCLVCVKLGFTFEYDGHRIRAEKLDGTPVPQIESRQLSLSFSGKFNLTDERNIVNVNVKRPQGRFDLSVSLRKTAS